MIVIVDYGAGNLKSVANALAHVGAEFEVCNSPGTVERASKILLPGVGHFRTAMEHLHRSRMLAPLREKIVGGTPTLGICLGMQLLFDYGEEGARTAGFAILKGRVVRLGVKRVPHMGWNHIAIIQPCCPWLPRENASGPYYFAHGYIVAGQGKDALAATTDIEQISVPAIVGRDKLWGVQFHPEKSAELGLDILRRFSTC